MSWGTCLAAHRTLPWAIGAVGFKSTYEGGALPGDARAKGLRLAACNSFDVERWTRQQEADESMTCRPRETRELESFMEMWDANLEDQGFLEPFQRTAWQRC